MPLEKELEGDDRTDLDLAPQHVALIRAVCAAQPRTVVVLFNGSAVAVAPWIDGTAAVLEAWLSGQAAGGAIADVLFGVTDAVRSSRRDVPGSARRHPGVPRLSR